MSYKILLVEKFKKETKVRELGTFETAEAAQKRISETKWAGKRGSPHVVEASQVQAFIAQHRVLPKAQQTAEEAKKKHEKEKAKAAFERTREKAKYDPQARQILQSKYGITPKEPLKPKPLTKEQAMEKVQASLFERQKQAAIMERAGELATRLKFETAEEARERGYEVKAVPRTTFFPSVSAASEYAPPSKGLEVYGQLVEKGIIKTGIETPYTPAIGPPPKEEPIRPTLMGFGLPSRGYKIYTGYKKAEAFVSEKLIKPITETKPFKIRREIYADYKKYLESELEKKQFDIRFRKAVESKMISEGIEKKYMFTDVKRWKDIVGWGERKARPERFLEGGYYLGGKKIAVGVLPSKRVEIHEFGHYLEKQGIFEDSKIDIEKTKKMFIETEFAKKHRGGIGKFLYKPSQYAGEAFAESLSEFYKEPSKYVEKYPKLAEFHLKTLDIKEEPTRGFGQGLIKAKLFRLGIEERIGEAVREKPITTAATAGALFIGGGVLGAAGKLAARSKTATLLYKGTAGALTATYAVSKGIEIYKAPTAFEKGKEFAPIPFEVVTFGYGAKVGARGVAVGTKAIKTYKFERGIKEFYGRVTEKGVGYDPATEVFKPTGKMEIDLIKGERIVETVAVKRGFPTFGEAGEITGRQMQLKPKFKPEAEMFKAPTLDVKPRSYPTSDYLGKWVERPLKPSEIELAREPPRVLRKVAEKQKILQEFKMGKPVKPTFVIEFEPTKPSFFKSKKAQLSFGIEKTIEKPFEKYEFFETKPKRPFPEIKPRMELKAKPISTPKILPLGKVKLKSKLAPKQIPKLQQIPVFKPIIEEEIKPFSIVKPRIAVIQKPIQRPIQKPMQRPRAIVQPKFDIPFPTPTPPPSPFPGFKFQPTPTPTPKVIKPTIPAFKLKFPRRPTLKLGKKKRIKGAVRTFKYTPSVTAIVFNIKAKLPKKVKGLTGLEIRPLPKNYRRFK